MDEASTRGEPDRVPSGVGDDPGVRPAVGRDAAEIDEGPLRAARAQREAQREALPAAEVARRRRRKHGTRQLIEWTLLVIGAIALALVLRAFVVQAFYIPSDSMVPTLQEGDRVLVNKLSYRLHDVHRGDIVVFEAPPGQATEEIRDLVKRVIGLPGETIEGRDGRIYIDGDLLEEPYLPEGTISKEIPAFEVPADTYYMLGDNRLASRDSTVFGPIPESTIVGRVFVRLWPLSRFDFL
ncbi:MAG TPA: signal peptidase I [Acidimicrobiia bacterium]|nr:signal peptidase I [Acidimicrobiia bacterium]